MRWSFALLGDGTLHVIPHDMPPAANLVTVDLTEKHGVYVIDAGQAEALRQLLGQPSVKEVVRHVGPDAAGELERLLDAVTTLVERRAAERRGDNPAP